MVCADRAIAVSPFLYDFRVNVHNDKRLLCTMETNDIRKLNENNAI